MFHYTVCVEQTERTLSKDDVITQPAGSGGLGSKMYYPIECPEDTEDSALDVFHETVPIAVLDDFEITVQRGRRFNAAVYELHVRYVDVIAADEETAAEAARELVEAQDFDDGSEFVEVARLYQGEGRDGIRSMAAYDGGSLD